MNRRTIIILPLLVALSVAAGIVIGNLLRQNSQPVFSPIGSARPNKLTTILKLIENGYVDSVNTGNIIEKAIPNILENLDPHTAYIPARNMQEVQEEMRGNFSEIGRAHV